MAGTPRPAAYGRTARRLAPRRREARAARMGVVLPPWTAVPEPADLERRQRGRHRRVARRDEAPCRGEDRRGYSHLGRRSGREASDASRAAAVRALLWN